MIDFALLVNLLFFSFLAMAVMGFVGLISGNLSVGVFGAFLVFVQLASATISETLTALLYSSGVILLAIMGLKIWSFANKSGE